MSVLLPAVLDNSGLLKALLEMIIEMHKQKNCFAGEAVKNLYVLVLVFPFIQAPLGMQLPRQAGKIIFLPIYKSVGGFCRFARVWRHLYIHKNQLVMKPDYFLDSQVRV